MALAAIKPYEMPVPSYSKLYLYDLLLSAIIITKDFSAMGERISSSRRFLLRFALYQILLSKVSTSYFRPSRL